MVIGLIDVINGLDFLGIEGMGIWMMKIRMLLCDCKWNRELSEKL